MRHAVIYQREGTYACFPTLARARDGRLHTRFATRVLASHIDPRGGHLALVSVDEGETWQPGEGDPVDPTWANASGAILPAPTASLAWPGRSGSSSPPTAPGQVPFPASSPSRASAIVAGTHRSTRSWALARSSSLTQRSNGRASALTRR